MLTRVVGEGGGYRVESSMVNDTENGTQKVQIRIKKDVAE